MRRLAVAVLGLELVSFPAYSQYSAAPPAPPPAYWNGSSYYTPPPPYFRAPVYSYNRNPCPPNWTVQLGVCKPYRGN